MSGHGREAAMLTSANLQEHPLLASLYWQEYNSDEADNIF